MPKSLWMGHSNSSAVRHWGTVSAFLSFFCLSNVIKTQSPKWRDGELCFRILLSLLKAIFPIHSCFICLCSALGTFAYLHKHIAQKWVPPASLPIAWQSSVDFEERMKKSTQTGRAFCCTFFGSSFLYDLSWRRKSWATLRSASHLGSSYPFSLKTATTWLMVSETVLSTRGASRGRENCPWRIAMAKPLVILILCVWDMSLRKRLSLSPMLWQYSQ